MARNLRRYTNEKYPPHPTTPSEIRSAYEDHTTMKKFGFNLRNSHPFYINTVEYEQSAFTVFASHETMGMIVNIPIENRKYMVDGTFSVVPRGCFYQLLVIAIEFKNDVSDLSHFVLRG